MGDVEGRVVIVTGAGRGIGRGIARHLARQGAAVVIAEHREHRLHDATAVLDALGAAHLGVVCDVGRRADVDEMVARTIDRFGRIDGLVNNAVSPVGNPHREAWDAMYAHHPMGRDGDAEHDIAPAVAFSLSDSCRYLNGETLMLDGGGLMHA